MKRGVSRQNIIFLVSNHNKRKGALTLRARAQLGYMGCESTDT